MTYTDRTLACVDCGVEFIHSAADQEFYEQKGFVSDPKRCTSCRASRRASRDGGSDTDLRDIGTEDLFVHSTIFVIVDKQARLRGVFETEGEGVDWPKAKRKILAAAQQLEREP